MTLRATQRIPRRADSACELHEIRRVRSEPPSRSTDCDLDDRTVSMMVVAEPTQVERVGVFRAPSTDFQVLSEDMIEDLRERLRLAEQREATHGSGIRERPTPQDGLPSGLLDALDALEDGLDDLEIDIEPPTTLGQWAQTLGTPTAIEVALAPNSESNFYGGFDEEFPDGVFVATYQPIPADTPVYAVVHLPGGYRFRTPALVEFVREPEVATPDAPAGVGLRMCGLDGRMRRLIREFARHRPPMFYIG